MPATPTLLIAGCGDVGGRLARRMLAEGWRVHGLRRDVALLPAGVLPVAADLQQEGLPPQWPREGLDYLVYSVAASEHDEAGYQRAYVDGMRHVLQWMRQCGQRPRHVLFVSSSGVYAQAQGEWVDEFSPAEAERYSGRLMLEAERLLLDSGLPASVVRLTGIYGPGREWLLEQVRQGYRVVSEPPLYANRIHVDDCADLLAFLLLAAHRGTPLETCYIGVDDEPAALHEVVAWLREQLGVGHWSDEQAVRRSGSKRCSNARARALGWRPRFPSYREGYAQILQPADE